MGLETICWNSTFPSGRCCPYLLSCDFPLWEATQSLRPDAETTYHIPVCLNVTTIRSTPWAWNGKAVHCPDIQSVSLVELLWKFIPESGILLLFVENKEREQSLNRNNTIFFVFGDVFPFSTYMKGIRQHFWNSFICHNSQSLIRE